LPLVDTALVFDNSEGKHKLVAEKTIMGQFNIIDPIKFNEIKSSK
jgi:predicted ABC-type ATPase